MGLQAGLMSNDAAKEMLVGHDDMTGFMWVAGIEWKSLIIDKGIDLNLFQEKLWYIGHALHSTYLKTL